ncbi:hypothetical protein D172_004570 [Pseudoalteromonas sp. Bsw20308]|uniref:hypothetical protein n=1 Tax=Pseudoalteromonas sp. Bsw20308 TaxID=283699 RepID=UPI0005199CC6|nr:hypothetical protein [Pseudoalteromonas sp. Bsw20308]ALQ07403.1 hypothetical protein D172_004570 [Pseudoalteromonas sp. Bsw20308]
MIWEQLESIGNKMAGIFIKGLWLLVPIVILYSCIDNNTRWLKPDYNQPHEYLSIIGYGPNGESMEGNDYSYSGAGLYKDNFFPVGKGKCSEHLERISLDRVRLSMIAFNSLLNDKGDYNDIHVANVKFQCVKYLGRDKLCDERFMNLAKETKDPLASMLITLKSATQCRREQKIGKSKVFSLEK